MSRLPAVRALSSIVRSKRRGKQTIAQSADYLVAHRSDLERFDDVLHLALSTDAEYALPGTPPELTNAARPLGYHLTAVRAGLAEELWPRQIFVDAEVLDELVFWAARDPLVSDPVQAVLEWIRDARASRPGLMVFPLHSLGVLGFGLLRPSQGRLSFVNPAYGYALTPQTNALDRTMAFLAEVGREFGVRKQVPTELVEHWRRSRPTGWLERNPLLAVRTIQLPGSYYGNEWLLVSRVRSTTGLLCMLAALQPPSDRTGKLFSTRTMNNFQTLDIHHYITLFDNPTKRGALDGHCVPIHASRLFISELSDLEIDIDPAHWRRNRALGERVHRAAEAVYTEYLRDRIAAPRQNARTRTVRKLFDGVGFFRRSYQRGSSDWRAKVSLATAFEMLLTDSYGAVRATLQRRTRLLLKGVPGTRSMQAAVGNLYESRSELVHTGSDDAEVDMALARRAFVLCFTELAERLPSLPERAATPIRDLTGDAA